MSNQITLQKVTYTKPELRYLPTGRPVLNLRICDQHRKYNEASRQWEDAGEPLWLNVSYFGTAAETLYPQIQDRAGVRLTITGTLRTRTYTTSAGETRQSMEVIADLITYTRNQPTRPAPSQTQPTHAAGTQSHVTPWEQATQATQVNPWEQATQQQQSSLNIEPPF